MAAYKRCVSFAGLGYVLIGLLASCSLEPRYRAPPLPVAKQWPIPAVSPAESVPHVAAANGHQPDMGFSDVGWRDFFTDPHLQELIAQALANNRDLRVAVLNVASARAQYRIQHADRLPSVEATGSYTRQELPPALSYGAPASIIPSYEVDLGISAFEIDLFGRVRSLSHAALEQYFTQEESRRNAQLVLIAEVADAYLTMAADVELQKLANDTLRNQRDSFALSEKLYQKGAASELDLEQARATVESARIDSARYDGNVKQDINALTLLVGKSIDKDLLPSSLDGQVIGLQDLPANLSSAALLRRPDVLAAEHTLRAANANIGAARAAFFPTISLTASAGVASEQLSNLFKSGASTWTLAPQVTLPIFEGGRLRAALAASHVNRDIAVAQYEKAIQAGFREVADELVLSSALVREQQAAAALSDTTRRAYELSQQRFKAGRDSYLDVLVSERSMYSAQQGLVAIRLSEQSNRVNLYKSLGGGWLERSR